jgi:RimJ/RimL family protein N-acetyltransferase
VIETEHLTLRKPTLEDAPGAAELLADTDVMRWLGGKTVPADDVPAVIEKWIARWDVNGCGPFSVLRREDGRWLGRVGILVWDTRGDWTHTTFADSAEFAQPELGWALTSEHWGQGYATEAARAVREWAYTDLGATRLVSLIDPANVASQRVAERLGATPGETIELFDNGPHVVWEHPRP